MYVYTHIYPYTAHIYVFAQTTALLTVSSFTNTGRLPSLKTFLFALS